MSEAEKLNYIHSTLQECQNNNIDEGMIMTSFKFIEELREKTNETI